MFQKQTTPACKPLAAKPKDRHMENIDITGDFITIRDTTFNINDLLSFKPQTIVKYYQARPGAKLQKIFQDYSKIIVTTKSERFEFSYNDDDERDSVLRDLTQKIKIHQATKTNSIPAQTGGNISINVADSSNVNIVHQSKDVNISTKQVNDAKGIIKQIREELEKHRAEHTQDVEDIAEAIDDIERKLENKERIPKLSFKSLLETASNLSSVSSLAITLGQIVGVIPPLA